tara:strand:- start:8823 stop:10121 length:1299 start_codon:yes stop_codon:yes gene_type:complete
MTLLHLALRSLLNRRLTVGLTVLSVACSVMLLLGVERLRTESRQSFMSTVAGTDLVVGARSDGPQLLLQAVFNIGYPTRNIGLDAYEEIAANPAVAWIIPLSVGDTHRGFRVVGTNESYLTHYQFARDRHLELESGDWFSGEDSAVLGAAVARELGYRVGQEMVVAHGAGEISFAHHEEHPFRVSGVLAATGTPVDRTVLVSLRGIDAMHAEFQGARDQTVDITDPLAVAMARAEAHDHAHDDHGEIGSGSLSALLVGLHQRGAALGLQRSINESDAEPLTAVLPGVALQELWVVVGVIERSLLLLGGFVVVVGLMGMLSNLLATLDQRRREMAILRSVGARPGQIMALLVVETSLVTAAGAVLGLGLVSAAMLFGAPILETRYGLYLEVGAPSAAELRLLVGVVLAGTIIGLIPGWRVYRHALIDGLTPRL